jgi:hypothetical protein
MGKKVDIPVEFIEVRSYGDPDYEEDGYVAVLYEGKTKPEAFSKERDNNASASRAFTRAY